MLVLDTLDKRSFCEGLSPEYQQRLLSLGEVRSYQPGERIFFEGQSSQHIYLLSAGQVALETSMPGQEPMRVQTVGAGELLGWSPVLGLGVMTATARALTPCHALAFDATGILSLAEEDPKFVLEFMRRTAITLARRLNATRLQLVEACGCEGQQVS
jgi:CRP/FNR family cyclic AMP-dependent transcriptional regulator